MVAESSGADPRPDTAASPRRSAIRPATDVGAHRLDRPEPVEPCRWVFHAPEPDDADGFLGEGADLAPSTLVHAYRNGIFPWPHPQAPLPWFSPDPRGLLDPAAVRVRKSLRQALRNRGWTTTVDHAFGAVIRACGPERGEDTWIVDEMLTAYERLHRLGWAHSVEVWDGGRLIGGLYGVLVGSVFTGESMFHRERDASKVALVDLCARMLEAAALLDRPGECLVDVQLPTEHLETMGVRGVARDRYLEVLAVLRDLPLPMSVRRLPAARLADRPDPAET